MHKVLIVDDERMIVNSLVLGFPWKDHGFEVVATAASGREALALIQGLHPDVVFTDIKMPGMSGLELMSQAKHSGAVFVVISGHAEFSFAQKALELGAAAYCLKPLEDDEIAAALSKAKQLLEHSDELRHAALLRFLTDPTAENADALLQPRGVSGKMAVGLSLGDAMPLLSGAVSCVNFSLDASCRLYLFPQDDAYLEGYAFRAALLSALTSGAVRAFVYEETEAPNAYLRERLGDLMDQLYVGFFSQKQTALGKTRTEPRPEPEWLRELSSLCNRNRPNEVLSRLHALEGEPAERCVMSEALRIHNLCDALLRRMRNQPSGGGLRYGYELAARYASFSQMLGRLSGQLGHALGPVADPEGIRNETLARVVAEINRDFTKAVSFPELCNRYCINPSYLSQLFKKELNTTFTAYVNRLRIGYAKELLESTTTLVSEVSDRVGYDNYLNFTKLFKKETGITPKQYRLNSRKQSGKEGENP